MKKIQINETETDTVKLLQTQNMILAELYNLQISQAKEQHRWELLKGFIHLVPFILLAIALIWVYLQLSSYIATLNTQIGAIKSNFDTLMTVVNQQYQFLTQSFQSVQQSLQNLTPNLDNIGDSIKNILN